MKAQKKVKQNQPYLAGHTPPQHLESEKSVLGAMMLSEDCLHEMLELLDAEDFYAPAHRKIFEVMRKLSPMGKAVDHIMVHDELLKQGTLEEVGDALFIADLTLNVPTLSNASYYAGIVKEKSQLRQLLHLTMDLQEKIFDQEDANAAYEHAESHLMKLSEKRVHENSSDIGSLITDAMSNFMKRQEGDEEQKGLTCHYYGLMKMLNSFGGGEMIIVAARPSMGKTSFGLNLMLDMAIRQHGSTAFFSLEMGANQIANNMICMESSTDGNFWRNPTSAIQEDDHDRIAKGVERISSAKIIIDDEPFLTPIILRSKLRRYVKEHKVDIVFIDYLQLMTAPEVSSKEGRTQEMSHISRSLKSIAKELNIPIVALAQLNRAVESRAGNRPKMADLRESGSLEQDADSIILLHRPDYYNPDDRPGEVDVILAKNRNGETGTAPLSFVKNMMRFENLSHE